MTLPTSLPITIQDIEAEFSAPAGTPFSEFVKGGTYVPDNSENVNVPTSLPLAITDFYGAAATVPVSVTIPQDPANTLIQQYIVPGVNEVEEHLDQSPFLGDPNEMFVVDFNVKCNVGHVDGNQTSPNLPGYSWQKQRMSMYVGVDASGVNNVYGLRLDFFFTDSTFGYIRASMVAVSEIDSTFFDEQDMQGSEYQDKPDNTYGTFTIPTDSDYVRVKVVRKGEYTQTRFTSPFYYASNWEVTLYTREGTDVVWKSIPVISAPISGRPGVWNGGGPLIIANNIYTNNAKCNLEFNSIQAFVGGTVIP